VFYALRPESKSVLNAGVISSIECKVSPFTVDRCENRTWHRSGIPWHTAAHYSLL